MFIFGWGFAFGPKNRFIIGAISGHTSLNLLIFCNGGENVGLVIKYHAIFYIHFFQIKLGFWGLELLQGIIADIIHHFWRVPIFIVLSIVIGGTLGDKISFLDKNFSYALNSFFVCVLKYLEFCINLPEIIAREVNFEQFSLGIQGIAFGNSGHHGWEFFIFIGIDPSDLCIEENF